MPGQPSNAARSYRALIVQGQPSAVDRILPTLHRVGCETVVVGSPLEVLQHFGRKRFDLIVMDAEVEASSQDAAEALYRHSSTPVLYICANSRAIGLQALTRGIGFLIPPLDPAHTQAMVKRALRGPGMMA